MHRCRLRKTIELTWCIVPAAGAATYVSASLVMHSRRTCPAPPISAARSQNFLPNLNLIAAGKDTLPPLSSSQTRPPRCAVCTALSICALCPAVVPCRGGARYCGVGDPRVHACKPAFFATQQCASLVKTCRAGLAGSRINWVPRRWTSPATLALAGCPITTAHAVTAAGAPIFIPNGRRSPHFSLVPYSLSLSFPFPERQVELQRQTQVQLDSRMAALAEFCVPATTMMMS